MLCRGPGTGKGHTARAPDAQFARNREKGFERLNRFSGVGFRSYLYRVKPHTVASSHGIKSVVSNAKLSFPANTRPQGPTSPSSNDLPWPLSPGAPSTTPSVGTALTLTVSPFARRPEAIPDQRELHRRRIHVESTRSDHGDDDDDDGYDGLCVMMMVV